MSIRGWTLFFLWLCSGCWEATAQLPLPAQPIYVHYNSHNSSLPTELIYKIIADRNGYLWLATDKGLVRYDGRTFVLIPTGRTEDFVSVFRTREDLLWLFAFSGHTSGIDLNTQKVINTDSLYGIYKLTPPTRPYLLGLQSGRWITLYQQGSKGKIAIDTKTRQSTFGTMSRTAIVEELLTKYRLTYPSLRRELDSLFRHNAYGISVKDSFVTILNKIFLSAGGKEATLYFNGEDYGINDYIMGFARRGDDLFLGGQLMGLCKIAGYFSLPRRMQAVVSLLPDRPINYIEKDYLGNIWVSAYGGGLFLFPYKDRNTLYYTKEHSGLSSDEVTYVNRFGSGLAAVGYSNATVDFFRPGAASVHYLLPGKRPMREVVEIVDTKQRWLLFTRKEAFYARPGAGLLPDSFRQVPFRKHVGIAPGYKEGGLLNQVFYYASGNGIAKVDTAGVIRWHPDDKERFRLKRTCLLPLADTVFYIGTIRGCYRNDKLLPYLEDAQINNLKLVGDRLFIGANTGVYAVPLNAVGNRDSLRKVIGDPCYTIKHDSAYTYLRCIDELVIVQNSTLKVLNRFSFRQYRIPFELSDFYIGGDYIMLAGNQGIFCMPKQDMIQPELPSVPQIHVLCSLNDYSPADTMYKCRYQAGLSALFELDILDYRSDSWKITYRLFKDGEEIYSQAGIREEGQINFQPDGPGVYRVVYGVRPGYGNGERVVSFTIIITPLWYQQWWFAPMLVLIFLATFTYLLRKAFAYKASQNARRLEQKIYLQELESKSLFGQLKPHFIFNILTPLQGYFIREEKMKGLSYLNNFSRLMRGILDGIRDKYTTLDRETVFLEQYLSIQQERFDHSFDYDIRVGVSLSPDRYLIPSLLIQPVVENAIEHGIDKNGTGGKIDIVISETADALLIIITDNGTGLPPGFALKENHALKIITERMALLRMKHGIGHFHITSRSDGRSGTTAIFRLAKHIR